MLLTRVAKWSVLKAWGLRLAKRSGCGTMGLTSAGHHRRPPNKQHERLTGFPPTRGKQGPCRDVGVGEIAPGFATPFWAKRASHIGPPASSDAIMPKACSYRGENHGPGKDAHRELELRPGIREQPGMFAVAPRAVKDRI